MKNEWQIRLLKTGKGQSDLARILDQDRGTIHRQISGTLKGGIPHRIKAIILALELMAETDPKLIDLWLERSLAEQAASQEQDAT